MHLHQFLLSLNFQKNPGLIDYTFKSRGEKYLSFTRAVSLFHFRGLLSNNAAVQLFVMNTVRTECMLFLTCSTSPPQKGAVLSPAGLSPCTRGPGSALQRFLVSPSCLENCTFKTINSSVWELVFCYISPQRSVQAMIKT